ncbi:UDP-N-acetylenolpyruvoylglucosamine reductase [Enemella evansiae]|uniref:UDP-N-acetylenolpyruvoylglucosamine reductase n=1 Tax=Enemella evansiae TaxID=2016499 RepID=A0A255GCU9_9ACTN|nr:UDP-N-acetylenolpyruvoylglucosamine reductase [Enemella evansiae]
MAEAPQIPSTRPQAAYSGNDGSTLAGLTTLRVGGPAGTLVTATSEPELIAAVRDADERGEPVLLVGGGSNLVVADEGFAGTVIRIATRGIEVDSSACSGAFVTAAAGENWDDLVARAVAEGWVGIECLSGIPGLVGATPIQNVGAYGQEVSQTIARVRTLDRSTGQVRTFSAADCDFSYRHSRFKAEPDRWMVLSVTFQFELGDLSAPIRYAELARRLGVEPGQRVPAADAREAVLALRRGKGMVLEPDDHDTWSAGSFFTNPILTTEQAAALPDDAPRYPAGEGLVKTSAAWLIDHAGFTKGFGADVGTGAAQLSGKHTLALTNRGRARAADVLELARTIRAGVEERFGVRLVNEPVLVGCTL